MYSINYPIPAAFHRENDYFTDKQYINLCVIIIDEWAIKGTRSLFMVGGGGVKSPKQVSEFSESGH